MPNLVTWLREKDVKWFQRFFSRHPDLCVCNAKREAVRLEEMEGLLLTGGSDISPEFLRQQVVEPGLLEEDLDPERDRWEFDALGLAIERGIPVLAICRGVQVLNVALDGTLKLDIQGHNLPEQKERDIQPLRHDRRTQHRFEKVNSWHHQALDQVAGELEVEAWCATDDIIEQVRLRGRHFAVGVQYHPERGTIYDALFEDFFSHVRRFNDSIA
jgi:putative glutamine amidotransferase